MLILLHGYARSGKTTLLNNLKQKGYHIFSTSRELDNVAIARWLEEYPDSLLEYNTQGARVYLREGFIKKNRDYFFKQYSGMTAREFKIDTAENYFVPQFGRKEFIERTFRNQAIPSRYFNHYDFAIFETIGGEEASLVREFSTYSTLSIDLRSKDEKTGIDIRELSNENEIWNFKDRPSIDFCELFIKKLTKIISSRKLNIS